MAKYYYSPIGDLTKEVLEDRSIPHSRDGHGWGKIDWRLEHLGSPVPIYSMTDGVLSSISDGDSDGNQGYMVVIVSDKKDKNDWPIVINYLELSGLSGPLAEAFGVEDEPNTSQDHVGKRVSCYDRGVSVKMGEQIGYSNAFSGYQGSSVHIDFTYNDRFNGSYTPPSGAPGYSGSDKDSVPQIDNDFYEQYKTDLFDGKEKVWTNQSYGSTTEYDINPIIPYLVMCQKPVYLSGSSGSSGANYESSGTLLDRAKQHSLWSQVSYSLGSKEAINKARIVYNAFLPKFGAARAAAIAANGIYENLSKCLSNISDDGKSYTSTWGFGTDGISSQTDGGWFAFHPWSEKVPTLKKILKAIGKSDSCLNSEAGGTAEIQIAIYNEIFSQSSAGKNYGLVNRSYNGEGGLNSSQIAEVKENIPIFVQSGLQACISEDPMVLCAAFERGFEGSNLSYIGSRYIGAQVIYDLFNS